jgi:LPXTG-site transpeptidase (sortase) family protein
MTGRHRRRRWSLLPGVVALLAVLSVTTGMTVGGLLPDIVAGTATAAEPVVLVKGLDKPATSESPASEPKPPPKPAPRTSTAPPPEPPAEPVGQAPGTVRLTRGGTATLVRKEVIDGVLPVPDGVREATWWGAGLDADAGATVLAGHVNWRGTTGPFAELWDARRGDTVTVVDRAGRTFEYRVSEIVTLDKEELPARAGELFGQSGDHRLVLVTCGGRWIGGPEGYADNRIVIARPGGYR